MKLTSSFLKGFVSALGLNFLVLLGIYFFFERVGSFSFFLESAWDLKTLVAYMSIASIPAIALFSYMIQKPKSDFAQGILTEIILVVAFIAILKFFV